MKKGTLSERDKDILWDYRNHQEELLYQRINVFLIAQSMLFVAYTTAAEKATQSLVTGAIAYLGTVLTILGWFSIIRQRFVFEFARNYGKDRISAHGKLQRERKEKENKLWFQGHFEGQKLLSYSIPLLMLIVWLALTVHSNLNIPTNWLNEISQSVLTFRVLWGAGFFLCFLFFKRSSFWPFTGNSSQTYEGNLQKFLASIPFTLLLGWFVLGVLTFFKAPAQTGVNYHSLNYILFGLVFLFVSILPAFRARA